MSIYKPGFSECNWPKKSSPHVPVFDVKKEGFFFFIEKWQITRRKNAKFVR